MRIVSVLLLLLVAAMLYLTLGDVQEGAALFCFVFVTIGRIARPQSHENGFRERSIRVTQFE